MAIEYGRRFHYMRYVMALLGSVTFFLLTIAQDKDSRIMFRVWVGEHEMSYDVIMHIHMAVKIVVILLAGFLQKKIPAKWTILVIMILHMFLALLNQIIESPRSSTFLALFASFNLLISPSICLIAMHSIIAQWSPPKERIMITSIVYSGIAFALIFIYSAYEISEDSVAFFILQSVSVLWIIFWCILINDSPATQRLFVSIREKNYIATSIKEREPQDESKSLRTILLSKPFIAVALIGASNKMMQFMPGAIRVYHYMQVINLHSLTQTLATIICGIVLTLCLRTKVLSLDLSRKLPGIAALIGPLPFVIGIYAGASDNARHVCQVICHMLLGMKYSGNIVNIIDISPNHAALLMAIVLAIAEATSLTLFHVLFLMHTDSAPWTLYTVLPLLILFIIGSAVFYWFYGSTNQQTSVPVMIVADPNSGKIHSYGPVAVQEINTSPQTA